MQKVDYLEIVNWIVLEKNPLERTISFIKKRVNQILCWEMVGQKQCLYIYIYIYIYIEQAHSWHTATTSFFY